MARPRKNPLFITKTCPTCNKSFTISYRKKRQIFCNKSCANHHPDIIGKMKKSQRETYLKKYGVDHPMKTKNTLENFKKSMVKIYGVSHALQSPEFMEKSKKTKRDKYGDENYNNTEKRKKTCMLIYGVDSVTKDRSVLDKISLSRKLKHYSFLKSFCDQIELIPLFDFENYHGYHFSNSYNFKCKICCHTFKTTVFNLNNIFCPTCNPYRKLSMETDLFLFVKELLPNDIVHRNDRTILVGKEIDIYIPSKKIGIEFNGLYWHSEIKGKRNKQYHASKLKNCMFHGVKLIQIMESEWLSSPDVVKSIIKNNLNIKEKTNSVYARECEIKEISTNEKNKFLNENHIQKKDASTIKIGLFYNDELVSVMTFRKKSRFEKNIEWEMTRMCSKLDHVIVGGVSKMFSYFIKTYNPISIVSYSDRRYFDGNVYSILGFKCMSVTPPNYYYLSNDYKSIMNRMSFQKHKLEKILPIFDPNKSEWENMKNNGYDRIWDCGCTKWVWTY